MQHRHGCWQDQSASRCRATELDGSDVFGTGKISDLAATSSHVALSYAIAVRRLKPRCSFCFGADPRTVPEQTCCQPLPGVHRATEKVKREKNDDHTVETCRAMRETRYM